MVELISLMLVALTGVEGFCPLTCDCEGGDQLQVECRQAALEVIKLCRYYISFTLYFQIVPMTLNPEIQVLVLQFNKIEEIGSASFQFHPELITVDLSHNQLQHIQDKTFEAQKLLLNLNLSENKLRVLRSEMFLGLDSLSYLDISHNHISHLPSEIFQSLGKLKNLNLGSNRISTVAGQAFHGLTNLRLLDLRNNLLTNLCENMLATVPHLMSLDLSQNRLTNISKEAFKNIPNLTSLNLSSTNLSSVSNLSSLIRLEELFLSNTNLPSLYSGVFSRMTRLHLISVQHCKNLRYIHSGAFSDNRDLSVVAISHNENLAYVDENTFNNLPNLKDLDISHNKISNLNLNLNPSATLKSMQLEGNPWVCNCSLYPLVKQILSLGDQVVETRPECAEPFRIKGTHLDISQFSDCEKFDLESFPIHFLQVLCGGFAAILLLSLILGFFRDRIRTHIKNLIWRKKESSNKNKVYEYQSSFIQYDEYFLCLAQHQYQMENIPVTEL